MAGRGRRTAATTTARPRASRTAEPVSAVATACASSSCARRRRAPAPARGPALAPPAPAATVTRTLTPSDTPSCWAALTTPEAAPASSGATPAMPARRRAARARRPSRARAARAGARCRGRTASSTSSRLSHAMPARATDTPATSSRASPQRADRRGTNRTIENITAVIGRNAIPACSGLKPRTPCRYWLRKKNIENIPPTSEHPGDVGARPPRGSANSRSGVTGCDGAPLDGDERPRAGRRPRANDATVSASPHPASAARTKP